MSNNHMDLAQWIWNHFEEWWLVAPILAYFAIILLWFVIGEKKER